MNRKQYLNRRGEPRRADRRGAHNRRVIIVERCGEWERTYHFTKGYAWRRA